MTDAFAVKEYQRAQLTIEHSPIRPSAVNHTSASNANLSLSRLHARDADEMDRVYEGLEPGYTYAREGNPNSALLSDRIAQLEGAEASLTTCSGMSAVSAVLLTLLRAGDHVVAGNQLYGRTLRLIRRELPRFGIHIDVVDASDLTSLRATLRPNTRMMLVEVVSNPLLQIADIVTLSRMARSNGTLLVVDNTFPTPLGFRPLEWNAGLVIHSVTKMLSGHSDVTLGAVCGSKTLLNSIFETVVTWGLNPSPFDCWMAERGLNTLEVRLTRAQSNASELADFLANEPAVYRVIYPGRSDHPHHKLACRLFKDQFGIMLSFELNGGRKSVNKFLQALSGISFAPTLGDVSTTVSHPASSSHRDLSRQDREAIGISEGLLRVSVGIENLAVLQESFHRALNG